MTTRRNSISYRTHDLGRWTVSFFSAWRCDGSHRWPTVDVIYRQRLAGQACGGGDAIRYRRVSVPMPWVRFSTAYRFRRLGAMVAYRRLSSLYRAITA